MNAIEFLRRTAEEEGRIVSTNDLTQLQIALAMENGSLFVDDETGLGFVLLPWRVRTRKDEERDGIETT